MEEKTFTAADFHRAKQFNVEITPEMIVFFEDWANGRQEFIDEYDALAMQPYRGYVSEQEPMSGCIAFRKEGADFELMATPNWEREKGITPFQIGHSEDGLMEFDFKNGEAPAETTDLDLTAFNGDIEAQTRAYTKEVHRIIDLMIELEEKNSPPLYTEKDAIEILNVGMTVREGQLHGFDVGSGIDAFNEWKEKREKV
jgi:hypothetical protein